MIHSKMEKISRIYAAAVCFAVARVLILSFPLPNINTYMNIVVFMVHVEAQDWKRAWNIYIYKKKCRMKFVILKEMPRFEVKWIGNGVSQCDIVCNGAI